MKHCIFCADTGIDKRIPNRARICIMCPQGEIAQDAINAKLKIRNAEIEERRSLDATLKGRTW